MRSGGGARGAVGEEARVSRQHEHYVMDWNILILNKV
jgi:hypothetical protein